MDPSWVPLCVEWGQIGEGGISVCSWCTCVGCAWRGVGGGELERGTKKLTFHSSQRVVEGSSGWLNLDEGAWGVHVKEKGVLVCAGEIFSSVP